MRIQGIYNFLSTLNYCFIYLSINVKFYKPNIIITIYFIFLFFIGNTDSSKVQTIKIQQFPFSSYDLSIGKYLDKAVDEFINSYYEKKPTINDTEINYLAFFDENEKMKKLLVEECKFIKLVIICLAQELYAS